METKIIQKENIPYAKNMQTINFELKTERKGKPNFYLSVINCCASTLTSKLIEYTKKGGDINNLSPDNVFKK